MKNTTRSPYPATSSFAGEKGLPHREQPQRHATTFLHLLVAGALIILKTDGNGWNQYRRTQILRKTHSWPRSRRRLANEDAESILLNECATAPFYAWTRNPSHMYEALPSKF